MNSTIPADLLELQSRFETWRTNRKYMREPIPDELWKAAADLSRRYPPSLAGRVLSAKKRRAEKSAIFSQNRDRNQITMERNLSISKLHFHKCREERGSVRFATLRDAIAI
jgi:hypothetical protein